MRGWRKKYIPIIVGAAGALVIAGYNGLDSTGSVYVAVNGSDTTCVRGNPSLPCASIDKAHSLAQAGDTINVLPGTYSNQTINNAGPSGSPVTVNASSSVVIPQLLIDPPASNIVFEGMTSAFVRVGGTCSNTAAVCGTRATSITLQDIDMQSFVISYVDGVTIDGGDVGPAESCNQPTQGLAADHPRIGHNHSSVANWAPKNVTVQDVYFHDITSGCASQGTQYHTECILLWSGDTVTVKRNTFRNCGVGSTGTVYFTKINLGDLSASVPCTAITFENNFLYGNDNGTYDFVHFGDDCATVIRNNSLSRNSKLFLLRDSVSAAQTLLVAGNIGLRPVTSGLNDCASISSHVTIRDNVWSNRDSGGTGKCHSSDTGVATLPFVSESSDLHITSGSSAVDAGYLTSYPSDDIDGDSRYMGSAPDAGADEKE